ncbi:hypothetical protein XA68_17585 [Ophiocordyceps unilateralis]|uniref:Uncharacterized protein n=1 Tax=Ophiocordyceps unilateralis TaxID=268505 RepID=A0A2A9P4L1_OPHUN|nr:hypothetical protein XA68_17585 [Ophiocordyceps unilateralis]
MIKSACIISQWRAPSRLLPARRWTGTTGNPPFRPSTVPTAPEPEPEPESESEQQQQQQQQQQDDRVAKSRDNSKRNSRIRSAFSLTSPNIRAAVLRTMYKWPYVAEPRRYPAPRTNRRQRAKTARVQVGYKLVALQGLGFRAPDWRKTLELLEKLTPRRADMPLMSALRIVLPTKVDDLHLPAPPGKINVLDSTTLLVNRLIAVVEKHKRPSNTVVEREDNTTVVIRGRRDVLAQAADDLIAVCKEVRIFQLGHVSAVDYETRCLWPLPDDDDHHHHHQTDESVSLYTQSHRIWVHQEPPQTVWIDCRYEDIPKPASWTADSLDSYMTTLVRSRLRSHLVMSLYRRPGKAGKLIDVEAFKVRLILQTLEKPAVRGLISPRVLKTVLAYMIHRGGHAAEANRLFHLAQRWGVPVDTDLFNIMMHAYVVRHDVARFHGLLHQMTGYYQSPDITTWLLFLRLLQRGEEQQLVMSSMFNLGLFDAPAARRCVAAITADRDTYLALRAGQGLYDFLTAQAARHGPDWLSTPALNAILTEAFHFRRSDWRTDLLKLLDGETSPLASLPLDITTFNLLLAQCAKRRDWVATLRVLARMHRHGCHPDERTYQTLVPLAQKSRAPFAIGLLFFYAVLDRNLRRSARKTMLYIFTGRHQDPFWSAYRPRIFSKPMARSVKESPVVHANSAVAAAEWAILDRCHGYRPDQPLHEALAVTWRTMDIPLHRIYNGGSPPHRPLRYFTVRMRDPAGVRPKMMVHLDAWFDYKHMVRGYQSQLDDADADADAAAAADDDDDDDEYDDDASTDSYPLLKDFEPQPLGPWLEELTPSRPTADEMYRRIREPEPDPLPLSAEPKRDGRWRQTKSKRRKRVFWFRYRGKLRCWARRGARRDFWTAGPQDRPPESTEADRGPVKDGL